MTIDPNSIQKVRQAMQNKFEEKAQKRTSIGADPGATEYPTSVAVKNFVEGKNYLTSTDVSGKFDTNNITTTSWPSTLSDTRVASEKLVKNSLDDKVDASSITDVVRTSETTGLIKNDGTIDTNTYLTEHQSLTNYVTTSDSRLSDARTPTSHTHGNISNDGKIGTDSGKIITTGAGGELQASASITKSMISDFPTEMTPATHSQASSTITDSTTYANIGNSAQTQASINAAVNEKLGALASIDFIEWDTAGNNGEPSTTAAASTMNKLYLIKATSGKDDNYDVFVTKRSGTSGSYTYAWEKIDAVSLDISGKANSADLAQVATTGSYTNLSDKPSFTQDSNITSSTAGRYAIGTINISGTSTTIYGVDTGSTSSEIESISDAEINEALEALALEIDPNINNNS